MVIMVGWGIMYWTAWAAKDDSDLVLLFVSASEPAFLPYEQGPKMRRALFK